MTLSYIQYILQYNQVQFTISQSPTQSYCFHQQTTPRHQLNEKQVLVDFSQRFSSVSQSMQEPEPKIIVSRYSKKTRTADFQQEK